MTKKLISGISLRFSMVVWSGFLLRVGLRRSRRLGRLMVGGVSLRRCRLLRRLWLLVGWLRCGRCRLLVGGLSCRRSRLLHRRAVPPRRLIVQGLGGSGLLRLLGVDGLGRHGRLRWGGGGWGCVGSTW